MVSPDHMLDTLTNTAMTNEDNWPFSIHAWVDSCNGYHLPLKEIRVDAPPLPLLLFSPHPDKILFFNCGSLSPLTDLARPDKKLAGILLMKATMHEVECHFTRDGNSYFIGR